MTSLECVAFPKLKTCLSLLHVLGYSKFFQVLLLYSVDTFIVQMSSCMKYFIAFNPEFIYDINCFNL